MGDAFAEIVGSILMLAYLGLIVAKLGEVPLWIAGLVGIALMLWGFWHDTFAPLLRRNGS